MILIIVLVVLVLVFCFIAYLLSKNWRWHQVTLMVLVFLTSIGSMLLSAIVLQTQANWRQVHARLSADLEKQDARLVQLQEGDILSDEAEASVPWLQSELNRQIIDRGRVWRNVQPNVGDGVIDLNMIAWGDDACANAGLELDDFDVPEPVAADEPPADDGEAAEPAAPTLRRPHQISAGMILHAFLEMAVTQLNETERTALLTDRNLVELDAHGACKIPGAFLGSFQVTQVGDRVISVQPTDELTENQAALLAQSTWAMYEIMPRDGHEVMTDYSPESIQALFGLATRIAQPDEETLAELATSIDEFCRNGSRAIVSGADADPAERTVYRVEFTRDHSVDVDVEEIEAGVEKPNFDFRGRAQTAELRQGSAIEFKAGEAGYFDSATAKRLVDSGVCKYAETDDAATYRRELRDYSYLLAQRKAQLRELAREMATLNDQQQAIVDATANAQNQIDYRTQELEKLAQDLENYQRELAVIKKVHGELSDYRAKQLQTLSFLYQSNLDSRKGQ